MRNMSYKTKKNNISKYIINKNNYNNISRFLIFLFIKMN